MPSEEYLRRKAKYISEYQRKTYANVSFKLRKDRDADVLEKLSQQKNVTAYIVDLIRKHG